MEVWKDALGLGHCSIPMTDRITEMSQATKLIESLGVVTESPIVFERITNHGTVIYGHSLN